MSGQSFTKAFCLITCLTAATFWQSSLAQEAPPFTVERFDFNEVVAAGSTLTVSNLYGDIRVKRSGNQEVAYRAVVQLIGEAPSPAELVSNKTKGGHELSLQYPNGTAPQTVTDGRIDVVVLVPDNLNLSISIERGKLIAEGLKNNLEVSTESSELRVSSSGSVNLSSVSGDIAFSAANAKSPNNHRIKTSSGDIAVTLPADNGFAVSAHTAADVTTNSIELLESEQQTTSGGKVYDRTMNIGNEQHSLNIFSDVGDVKLVVKTRQE